MPIPFPRIQYKRLETINGCLWKQQHIKERKSKLTQYLGRDVFRDYVPSWVSPYLLLEKLLKFDACFGNPIYRERLNAEG